MSLRLNWSRLLLFLLFGWPSILPIHCHLVGKMTYNIHDQELRWPTTFTHNQNEDNLQHPWSKRRWPTTSMINNKDDLQHPWSITRMTYNMHALSNYPSHVPWLQWLECWSNHQDGCGITDLHGGQWSPPEVTQFNSDECRDQFHGHDEPHCHRGKGLYGDLYPDGP